MPRRAGRGRRLLWILLGLLGLLLLAALAVGLYMYGVFKDTVRDIAAEETPQTLLAVYVLEEDEAAALEDTAGYAYGVCWSETEGGEAADLLDRLEERLGGRPAVTGFSDVFALADGLRDKRVRAVILNEAHKEGLQEAEGYGWTAQGMRRIEGFALEQEAEEEAAPPVPADLPARFIAYVSGIDTYGGLSARSRSDVNILLAVNTDTRKLQMVATPRDFYVDFAASKGQKDKLTHAGLYGVSASMDALERLYGVEIAYYLRLNFTGFIRIIDALGGVDVYSDYAFTVKNIRDYHKGINRLNGLEALAFARERYSFPNGDYQRAKNQMEVIRAVVDACASPAILRNYGAVMRAIGGSLQTNMPEEQITGLVGMQLTDRRAWTIASYTATGTGAYRPTWSMPGRNLSVILPDPASVEEAKRLIRENQAAA